MLNYDALIQESAEALEAHEKRLRRSAVSYRVRMLRLLKSGECRRMASAAGKLGYSMRQCQRRFRCYRQDGLKALLKFERPRRRERMTQAAWEALDRAMKAGEVATLEQTRQLLAEQRGALPERRRCEFAADPAQGQTQGGPVPASANRYKGCKQRLKKLRQQASQLGSKRQATTGLRL